VNCQASAPQRPRNGGRRFHRSAHLWADHYPNLQVSRRFHDGPRRSRRDHLEGGSRAVDGHECFVRGATVTGIVSAKARLAATIDVNGSVRVLLHRDDAGWRTVRFRDLLALLGDADDLRTVPSDAPEHLAAQLEQDVRKEQLTWLLLILLDKYRS